MNLHDLSPAPGSTKRKKRVGRGNGSGWGKTAGKGHKGQKARSGGGVRPGFEGGQMPLARRVPKRGFNNIFALRYTAVNLDALNAFDDGAVIDEQALIEKGIVKKAYDGVKILGGGELKKKLTVKTAKISGSAAEKIKQAGGTAEEQKPRGEVVSKYAKKKESVKGKVK